jgi:hypothetical protein
VPYFKSKATLAGSASGDLFKNTLSRIATVFGQLAYLASLRDPNTGVYDHHGLTHLFGREESRRALGESHTQVFQLWLDLSLSAKREDLAAYLTSREDSRPLVLDYWTKAGISRTYIPDRAHKGESELFVREFEIVLETLNC